MTWTLLPITQFTAYKSQWDILNNQTSNTPLLETDFIEPLLKHFSSGKELLAIYGDPSAPDAMAIIEKPKFGRWSTFQPSQAPIGCWLQKLDIDTEALTKSMLKALPGIKLIFSITQQDPALLPRPSESKALSTLDYIETAQVPVKGTFEEYWAQRGKNLRQNMRRQRNKLAREEITPTLKVIDTAAEIGESIKAYGKLESAGWKNEGNTAVNINNAQGRFYKELLERYCVKNCGVVFQFYYNDNLVATDLCINNSEYLIILKTTYDETINTTSPAILMKQDSFSYIFENKLANNIEFYGKVMTWHTKWSDSARAMYHINHYAKLLQAIPERLK